MNDKKLIINSILNEYSKIEEDYIDFIKLVIFLENLSVDTLNIIYKDLKNNVE